MKKFGRLFWIIIWAFFVVNFVYLTGCTVSFIHKEAPPFIFDIRVLCLINFACGVGLFTRGVDK